MRVSNDGSNWTLVWENGGEIDDTQWTQVEYDISAVADGQPTVYLRWSMGPTDGSWVYCGWNIDDIEIWGLQPATTDVADAALPARTALLGGVPNPFNPMTEVRFELATAGRARLAVYDLRGRLVKTLHDGALPAGPHAVRWDGTDAAGHAASSGAYLCRLESGEVAQMSKLLLAR
jgi:hypothetical protein